LRNRIQQVFQNIGNGKLGVATVPDPIVRPGHVLISNACSLISAGTEKMVMDLAKKSLLGNARERPDHFRRVLEKTGTKASSPLCNRFEKNSMNPLRPATVRPAWCSRAARGCGNSSRASARRPTARTPVSSVSRNISARGFPRRFHSNTRRSRCSVLSPCRTRGLPRLPHSPRITPPAIQVLQSLKKIFLFLRSTLTRLGGLSTPKRAQQCVKTKMVLRCNGCARIKNYFVTTNGLVVKSVTTNIRPRRQNFFSASI